MGLPIIAIGGLALLLRLKKKPKGFTCEYPQIKMQNDKGEWICGLDPDFKAPLPTDEVLEETWEMVYNEGNDYVWKYGVSMGLAYDDGSSTLNYMYLYLIGNADHTAFGRESQTDSGHWQVNGVYAKVYENEAAAIAKVVEMNEPTDNDPNDPTQPQPEPQPDDEEGDDNGGGFGGLPTYPSTDLGLQINLSGGI